MAEGQAGADAGDIRQRAKHIFGKSNPVFIATGQTVLEDFHLKMD